MLAVIAGKGGLPAALVARLADRPMMCQLAGFEPDDLTPDLVFRLEELGSFIATLKDRGVTQLCMVGAIQRPAVDPGKIDAATLPLVPVIQKALGAGDDGALRAMIAVFEGAGIDVVAAHALAPDLLLPEGCPTRVQPSAQDRDDADRGAQVLAAMAALDIGQTCVIKKGQVLAIEGLFGTDWLLESLGNRPDGTGGLFFKAPKPGQDRRADLPTIGPKTVAAAARAGLSGLVIEAGGVIVLQPDDVLAACDRHGLFLWVRAG